MPHGNLPLFYTFHFYLFGLLAIVSAIAFVTRRSPVAAVMWLVVAMFQLAALYVMLDAQFLGVIQVLVYAGAIMVVFLFVIMLLNLGHASEVADIRGNAGKLLAGLVGVALLAMILTITRTDLAVVAVLTDWPARLTGADAPDIRAIGFEVMGRSMFSFLFAAVTILFAMVGGILVAKHGGRLGLPAPGDEPR